MLCRIINRRLPDITCVTRASDDDIDNITDLQNASLDLARIDSDMLDGAINRSGIFQFLDISYENLAVLTPLYDKQIDIVVRDNAGIATLDNLKGKK